ncbi:MAG: restriction endonuclease subunit M [Lachnospiraceae bacterium]|nr:restriction endonuclease subunit M [Lachnospiraceae bacterium]
MKELNEQIDLLLKNFNGDHSVIESIQKADSIHPFSKESRLMAYLLSVGQITYDEYVQMGNEFYRRNQKNSQYLYLFDMAPRTFGQTWGEQHIRNLFPQFIKATKENLASLYPDFDGEFDLWLQGIRVEVKACRANSTTTKGSLASRAYTHEEALGYGFKYHYQQLKPSCCDVFIWIGVCKDKLLYWVLTSNELQNTGKLGSQHRNENTGVVGAEVFEGQVFMTEEELMPYEVSEQEILVTVMKKGRLSI